MHGIKNANESRTIEKIKGITQQNHHHSIIYRLIKICDFHNIFYFIISFRIEFFKMKTKMRVNIMKVNQKP